MRKSKTYANTRFSADVLREGLNAMRRVAEKVHNGDATTKILRVRHDDASWKYDDEEEFFADYRRFHQRAVLLFYWSKCELSFTADLGSVEVDVEAPARSDIESVFAVFEKHLKDSALPPEPEEVPRIVVFVGHGRSTLWRDL